MKVPLLDLAAQFRTVEPEVRAGIDRVLKTCGFVLGPEVEALEKEVARLCGVAHGIGVSNGSDAIVAALMALDIGAGDEVIVPVFTFFATAASVSRVGARPVFVDILPDTYNIDPDAIDKAISPRTKAIIPVHLYGQCADMDRVLAIADRHGIPVIEDAAQAIGATYKGRPACSFGKAATLSFYPTKNLSAIGEAGMVMTNDDKLAAALRIVRHQGQTSEYEHGRLGANFRMSAIQAVALRAKLPHLVAWNEGRCRHAARYDAALAGNCVVTPHRDAVCGHIYHQYTVRSPHRETLRTRLTEAGIGAKIFYPIPLHLQPVYRNLGYRAGDFPVAEKAAAEVLSLPVFPEMTVEQQDYVIETIRQVK
ncbi:MAG: DegT/DnrJ/EryC1/StrS family aminotransferase [Phycisphaerae bacterium]|jgi:dTDP-4-amino-4,6-dideoxygalactose transaminase|nr:DegT/DnrJ/EryC1/StrS family aminotransferase [Phycisphaerae bacterium]